MNKKRKELAVSDKKPSAEDQMMQWITSKWITKPIAVVSELGIADFLRQGPVSVEVLSEKTDTHPPTLYRILRALSSVGIFVETGEREFGLTPLAQCLLSDAMRPMARMFLSSWHDKAWEGLHYTVLTGKPGFDYAFGQPAFKWLEENSEERAIFDQAQAIKAVGLAGAIMKSYDFTDFHLICDVGGGGSAFLVRLLADYPHLKGIVADLPETTTAADEAIAKAGLNERCKAVAYDFLKGSPPVSDGYLLVNILHDWEDETCCQILKNVSLSMSTASKLCIVEYLIEPGPGFSIAKLLDIEVLVMGGGRERTMSDYEALINSVGLKVSRVVTADHGLALIECKITDNIR
jgi:hypothetical protein